MLLSLVLVSSVYSIDFNIDFDHFTDVNYSGDNGGRADNIGQLKYFLTDSTNTPALRIQAGLHDLGMTSGNNLNCTFFDFGKNDYGHGIALGDIYPNLTGKEIQFERGWTNDIEVGLICRSKKEFRLQNGSEFIFDYFKHPLDDGGASSGMSIQFINLMDGVCGPKVCIGTQDDINGGSCGYWTATWCGGGYDGTNYATSGSNFSGSAGVKSVNVDMLNSGIFSNVLYNSYDAVLVNIRKWYNGEQMIIGDINITNLVFNISDNSLPYVNLTYNESDYCYNDSVSNPILTIDLDIDAYDTENDVIYYSNSVSESSVPLRSYDYEDKFCISAEIGCVNYPNDEVLAYEYLNNNCEINVPNFLESFNESKHNVKEWLDWQGKGRYMLELNGFCSETDKSFYLNLPNIYNDLRYTTDLYGVNDGDSFNLTFYSSSFTRLLDLFFEKNGTSTYVIDNLNNRELIDTWNNEYGKFDEIFFNVFTNTSTNNESVFAFMYDSTDFKQVKSVDGSIRYVGIVPRNQTRLYQLEFSFTGSGLLQNWKIEKPTEVNISSSAVYTMYVTDASHLGIDSDKYTLSIDLLSCDYVFEGVISPTGIIINPNKNPLDLIDSLLGQSYRYYFNTMGTNDLAKTFIWWIFFGLVIFFAFVTYSLDNVINMEVVFIASGGLCFFLSMLLQYSGHMVSFLIISALGITPAILRGMNE